MNIKEIATKMTREEFLKECERENFTEYNLNCPRDLGLEDNCGITCRECWEKAIKNIKFKGDLDKFEIGKKYRVKMLEELKENRVTGKVANDPDTYHILDENDPTLFVTPHMDKLCGKKFVYNGSTTLYGWNVSPWMCEEVESDESLEDRMKKLGFKLSGGESYDELIDMIINTLSKKEIEHELDESLERVAEMVETPTKIEKHTYICNKLNNLYEAKNHDYGDSFGETFQKLGIISAVTRITDKVNRLQSLCTKEQLVNDESVKDTLMDLANYSIMTLIELDKDV